MNLWLIIFITWLCPTIGLTFFDIFFDSLLAIEYYAQWSNDSYVNKSMERCEECQTVFTSPDFNTTRSAIHCFEFCFSSEARLTYTLIFLLLPIVFYLTEFLTLTDRYEVTTLRRRLGRCLKEARENCCQPLKCLGSLLKLLGWTLVTIVTVIFWQPITAFFKVFLPPV